MKYASVLPEPATMSVHSEMHSSASHTCLSYTDKVIAFHHGSRAVALNRCWCGVAAQFDVFEKHWMEAKASEVHDWELAKLA